MGSGYDDILEHDDLDHGPQHHYYCIQLDVVLLDIVGRPMPASHVWTPAVICDMIKQDECIPLGLGSAILFFGR